jgi:hypothetical protein
MLLYLQSSFKRIFVLKIVGYTIANLFVPAYLTYTINNLLDSYRYNIELLLLRAFS